MAEKKGLMKRLAEGQIWTFYIQGWWSSPIPASADDGCIEFCLFAPPSCKITKTCCKIKIHLVHGWAIILPFSN